VIDSGFIFQNPHRRVAVPDVPMLEKGPMFPMSDVRCSHRTNTCCEIHVLQSWTPQGLGLEAPQGLSQGLEALPCQGLALTLASEAKGPSSFPCP